MRRVRYSNIERVVKEHRKHIKVIGVTELRVIIKRALFVTSGSTPAKETSVIMSIVLIMRNDFSAPYTPEILDPVPSLPPCNAVEVYF